MFISIYFYISNQTQCFYFSFTVIEDKSNTKIYFRKIKIFQLEFWNKNVIFV